MLLLTHPSASSFVVDECACLPGYCQCLQIQELREAIVLPITHKDRFVKLGIKPPKGVLLHGPPGACAATWRSCCRCHSFRWCRSNNSDG